LNHKCKLLKKHISCDGGNVEQSIEKYNIFTPYDAVKVKIQRIYDKDNITLL